tara:strand:- start:186 stop:548 length:363 start_codon:yes stop_codon:yes gene_type:complete
MTTKSSQSLVSEALKVVKTISSDEALKLYNENKCNLIDIREETELENNGKIENSIHIPRGLLEFSINPETIDLNKELVLFCAAGGRSALAVKSLNEMGFEKVSHIEGGFSAMSESGFKIT